MPLTDHPAGAVDVVDIPILVAFDLGPADAVVVKEASPGQGNFGVQFRRCGDDGGDGGDGGEGGGRFGAEFRKCG